MREEYEDSLDFMERKILKVGRKVKKRIDEKEKNIFYPQKQINLKGYRRGAE